MYAIMKMFYHVVFMLIQVHQIVLNASASNIKITFILRNFIHYTIHETIWKFAAILLI